MSCEKRVSIIDGSIEEHLVEPIRISEEISPLLGTVIKQEPRVSLIDGTIETVDILVIPPFDK